MALKSINPTQTKAFKNLAEHFNNIKDVHMKSMFLSDSNRKNNFSVTFKDILLDYSKNRINKQTLQYLIDLANEVDLKDAISKYFSGDKINETENRAVLHTALRNKSKSPIQVDGVDIMPEVNAALMKIKEFSNAIISGKLRGFTNKKFTDVINIGIGGSDLGPKMVVESLQYYKNNLNVHFISNIDGDHIKETLKNLNQETTLIVIVSKTFTTLETLTNALTVKDWFLEVAEENDVKKHFVAVSTNLEKVRNFGIANENIFPMWDWVGGRYSLWSAVGLSISLSVGFNKFDELLQGAFEMDEHFKNTNFNQNIPVIMALIGIWYTNFFNSETEAIIPYTQYLDKFVAHLQQVNMESNGKSVDRNGKPVNYQTGNIIWGSTGTNAQHAFMQLIHQGTKLIPVDFIGFEESLYGLTDHHKKLMANFYAQTQALCEGKTKEEVFLEIKLKNQLKDINKLLPYKVFEGNKPTNTIRIKKLTPRTLGMLIAMYEHKIFVQGVLWNIFSFDQFGVELGKSLAVKILQNS